MRAKHLIQILSEYRHSMKLIMMVDEKPRFEMTVAELISNLMTLPPDNHAEFFGCAFFILRERIKGVGPDPRSNDERLGVEGPHAREWLELDVRR